LAPSLNSGSGVASRQSGVPLAVLARLGAEFNQLIRSFVGAVPPIERRHTPDEVGAAYVRAGIAVVALSVIHASLIVRPFPGPYRIRVPAGNAKGNHGRGLYRLGFGNQSQGFQLGWRDYTARGDVKDDDFGKVGFVFAFVVRRAGNASGTGCGRIGS
jgi:hypothetical protein